MTGRRAAEPSPAPVARELLVVKLGGTTLADQEHILDEVAGVASQRDVVLVHGGGKRLTEWLDRLGIESRFEGGLRVTDDDALEAAVAVLRGLVNTDLVAALRSRGAEAVGLSGVDGGLLVGERVPALGRVASVVGVSPGVLYALFAAGKVPVVAPVATDEHGIVCNVNADDAAGGLAGGLQARLVLLTDTDGVRGPNGRRIPSLTVEQAEQLITDGVIAGGMVPKVRSGLRALAFPGAEAVIADGSAPAALSRALEDPAFGTRLRWAPSPTAASGAARPG